VINSPSAILVLMGENIARGFRQTTGIARAQQDVKDYVIGFQSGISFQFAAPVAFFVLVLKQAVTGSVDSCGHPADQVINFSETHLRNRRGGRRGGGVFHKFTVVTLLPPRWERLRWLPRSPAEAQTLRFPA